MTGNYSGLFGRRSKRRRNVIQISELHSYNLLKVIRSSSHCVLSMEIDKLSSKWVYAISCSSPRSASLHNTELVSHLIQREAALSTFCQALITHESLAVGYNIIPAPWLEISSLSIRASCIIRTTPSLLSRFLLLVRLSGD